MGPRRAVVGKKTFDGVRSAYTWNELYRIAYGEGIENYIKTLDANSIKDISDINILVRYVNVVIRSLTKRR